MKIIYNKILNKIKTIKSYNYELSSNINKPLLLAVHINSWKHSYIKKIFFKHEVIFLPFKLSEKHFNKYLKNKIKKRNNTEILVWGKNLPKFLELFANSNDILIKYVEDGFIRSVGLGSNYSLPISLNFDTKTPYFDATEESDLELILQSYNFKDDIKLQKRASELKNKILNLEISKYNHAKKVNLLDTYGKKTTKRVLVVGQVEDDASIIYGCDKPFTNNDLVRLARSENHNAQIIYKPHPDVLAKRRKKLSDPNEVKDIAQIIDIDIPISQALETIDHVYTITSQVGFEALLRDISVTTIGLPFYAGWGVTDNRQKCSRRTRILTVNEILAGAYILYPKYFNPTTVENITVEEALNILIKEKSKNDT